MQREKESDVEISRERLARFVSLSLYLKPWKLVRRKGTLKEQTFFKRKGRIVSSYSLNDVVIADLQGREEAKKTLTFPF